GDGLAVDHHALGEALEVGAGEEPGAQAMGAHETLDHPAGGRLAVRAGDVHHTVGLLRVVEQLQDAPRALDTRLHPALPLPLEQRRVHGVRTSAVAIGHRASSRSISSSSARAATLVTATSKAPAFAYVPAANSLTWPGSESAGRLPRGPYSAYSTASVSPATSAASNADSSAMRSSRSSKARSSRMRSLTSKPAAFRVSWTARITSRARPSASSSGVVAVSSSTNPPSGSRAMAIPSPAPPASSVSSYSPSCSATPSTTIAPSISSQTPALAPAITCCTCLPSRGPAARAFTVSRLLMP